MTSENSFRFPNNQIFYGSNFDPVARRFAQNDSREDYDDAPSNVHGQQLAVYVRDRFQIGPRVSIEAGCASSGRPVTSDIDVETVSATSLAPRISGSYALTADSKTLIVGSYGRFYDSILQGFSDSFANVPQQTNYSTFVWDGSAYIFSSRSESGANTFAPNADVSPRHLDEATIGFERQVGSMLGVGVRYIHREWGNFVDDIRTFNPDGTLNRVVDQHRLGGAQLQRHRAHARQAVVAQLVGLGQLHLLQTRGNHFGDDFTRARGLHRARCAARRWIQGSSAAGRSRAASSSRTSRARRRSTGRTSMKFNGAYTRPIGPVNLTAGVVGAITSKTTYTQARAPSAC